MGDRLYNFYFLDIKDPITVQAASSIAAREVLSRSTLPALYSNKKIIGETTSALVTGVSHMVINGEKLVWNGQKFTQCKPPHPAQK